MKIFNNIIGKGREVHSKINKGSENVKSIIKNNIGFFKAAVGAALLGYGVSASGATMQEKVSDANNDLNQTKISGEAVKDMSDWYMNIAGQIAKIVEDDGSIRTKKGGSTVDREIKREEGLAENKIKEVLSYMPDYSKNNLESGSTIAREIKREEGLTQDKILDYDFPIKEKNSLDFSINGDSISVSSDNGKCIGQVSSDLKNEIGIGGACTFANNITAGVTASVDNDEGNQFGWNLAFSKELSRIFNGGVYFGGKQYNARGNRADSSSLEGNIFGDLNLTDDCSIFASYGRNINKSKGYNKEESDVFNLRPECNIRDDLSFYLDYKKTDLNEKYGIGLEWRPGGKKMKDFIKRTNKKVRRNASNAAFDYNMVKIKKEDTVVNNNEEAEVLPAYELSYSHEGPVESGVPTASMVAENGPSAPVILNLSVNAPYSLSDNDKTLIFYPKTDGIVDPQSVKIYYKDKVVGTETYSVTWK